MRHQDPPFGRFTTWGACSRCGARVKYSTLARERLTGLLVCTSASGRPTRPCLDPWPEVFDFKVAPDRSIEPPREPLPTRWMLDDIFSAVRDIKPAPDDATRLNAFLGMHFQAAGAASFESYRLGLNQNQDVASVTTINSANYDGTFVPSNSLRTSTPPTAPTTIGIEAASGDTLLSVPWAKAKGI